MILSDTIVAISSSGGGLRAIVRLSGDAAHTLAGAVTDLPLTHDRGWFGDVSLRCLAPQNRLASVLLFKTPHSFTGQDIAELHLPNSPALTRAVIADILDIGRQKNLAVRPADPGEFSARAFFNGKIDLTEAEGIAATINAANEMELRAAASLREGDLHREIDEIAERVAAMLALVEAEIDFADEEDVQLIEPLELAGRIELTNADLSDLLQSCVRIDRLDSQPTIIFVGEPNVGKSSLINALANADRSIVSAVAGTTRDMLTITMQTSRGAIRLIDVPGEELATDEMRHKMMAARQSALLEADLVVRVVAHGERAISSLEESREFPARSVTVQNKADLLPTDEVTLEGRFPSGQRFVAREPWQLVSVKTGLHLAELRDVLPELVLAAENIGGGRMALNQRHRALLHQTRLALVNAIGLVRGIGENRHPELLAAELRHALDLLGQITGAISPDEVLGRIFSQFCIGK